MLRSAVILAGGEGVRMWPFATVRNKCALPVANVPNVRRQADALRQLGIERLVVVVGWNEASVRHAFLGAPEPPIFVQQPKDGGTAGAALAGLRAVGDEPTLVLCGDIVTASQTLRDFIGQAAETGAPGAVLCDEIAEAEGADWLSVQSEDGLMRRMVGHDAGAKQRWCGAAIVDPSFVPVLVANPGRMTSVPVGGMPPMEPDLAQSLNEWQVDIAAIPARGFVVDMDKPWHVLEASGRAAEHLTGSLEGSSVHPTAAIDDGAEIGGHVVLGAGARIGRRVVVEGNLILADGASLTNGAILRGGSVIGARSSVKEYCLIDERTVVGADCIVGHGAEMSGVMLDGAYLYHYCEICGVVGESVDIGAATVCGTLRFDDRDAEHRVAGRREHPRIGANASYFGDHSRTGVNVITMPGAKIGAYSCVGAGIVVYNDVPDRTLLLLKQETVTRPWGPERYGW